MEDPLLPCPFCGSIGVDADSLFAINHASTCYFYLAGKEVQYIPKSKVHIWNQRSPKTEESATASTNSAMLKLLCRLVKIDDSVGRLDSEKLMDLHSICVEARKLGATSA